MFKALPERVLTPKNKGQQIGKAFDSQTLRVNSVTGKNFRVCVEFYLTESITVAIWRILADFQLVQNCRHQFTAVNPHFLYQRYSTNVHSTDC
jgi:hypothetical protein